MITLPRPTREVVPKPTREVVPRHAREGLAFFFRATAMFQGSACAAGGW
jgi:hypothetical protein